MNHITTRPTSVLFVCLGNICRSPAAEAVMRKKAQALGLSIQFDSAGTADYHIGAPPDKRAIQVGQARGYDLSNLRARQVTLRDFYEFELIFAMDSANLAHLQRLHTQALATRQANPALSAVITAPALFDHLPVADPYYGDISDFDAMYAHLEQVCDAHLAHWHSLKP